MGSMNPDFIKSGHLIPGLQEEALIKVVKRYTDRILWGECVNTGNS